MEKTRTISLRLERTSGVIISSENFYRYPNVSFKEAQRKVEEAAGHCFVRFLFKILIMTSVRVAVRVLNKR